MKICVTAGAPGLDAMSETSITNAMQTLSAASIDVYLHQGAGSGSGVGGGRGGRGQ